MKKRDDECRWFVIPTAGETIPFLSITQSTIPCVLPIFHRVLASSAWWISNHIVPYADIWHFPSVISSLDQTVSSPLVLSSTLFHFCWVVPYFCMNEVYRFFVIVSIWFQHWPGVERWSTCVISFQGVWCSKSKRVYRSPLDFSALPPLRPTCVCVAFQYTVHRGELEGLWGKKGARERGSRVG